MSRRFVCAALFAATIAVAHAEVFRGVETFDAAWTIVRDSHFDPTFSGLNWESVRTELRPRAEAARNESELRNVIRDMLGRLGLSHFALIPSTADASTGGHSDLSADPGLDVRLINREILVTRVSSGGSATAAGVRPGWRVTQIDGTGAVDLISSLPESMSERLRHVEVWRRTQTRLRGPQGTTVTVTFDTGSRILPVSLTRRPEQGAPVTVGNLPTMYVRVESEARRTPAGHRAAVIGFNVWMPIVDAMFQKAVDEHRAADGIVLDLRGNPGGLAAMLMGISGHFLTERKPLGVMKTRQQELRFFSNPRLVSGSGTSVTPFSGPLAILVDAMTGSASECFAGGMQSLGRARVFGQTSMGQALPALFDRLPNGDVLIHAYGDFVTATGTRLEGRGVVPDESVPLRREDLLAGRDATLERALAWIDAAQNGSAGR